MRNTIEKLISGSNFEFTSKHTIFFKGYNNKKMGTLQFHIPGFQNDPSYPKQKEFLKFYEGKQLFWHFCPCASISKIHFAKCHLIECYERPITQFC